MAEDKKVQKKKVTASGRITPKKGAEDDEPAAPAKATAKAGDRPKLTSVVADVVEPGARGTRARTSGRVTEKGTQPSGKHRPSASTRYTPPTDRVVEMPSPWYIPALMFTLWGIGVLLIFLNYVELLPGAQSNWYLLGGLGAILAGIIVATQYR